MIAPILNYKSNGRIIFSFTLSIFSIITTNCTNNSSKKQETCIFGYKTKLKKHTNTSALSKQKTSNIVALATSNQGYVHISKVQ